MNAKDRLEQELLSAYDAKHPPQAMRRPSWPRYAAAAAALAALLTVSRAPASYQLEVGQRVEVLLPESADVHALAEDLAARVRGSGLALEEVQARFIGISGAPARLTLDAWGAGLDGPALVRAVRSNPALTRAQITVAPLAGPIRDTLGGRLRHSLFPKSATPEERERARQALIQEIQQREGADAKVEVQLAPDGQQVRVRVVKDAPK
jgi:hypothetical protein